MNKSELDILEKEVSDNVTVLLEKHGIEWQWRNNVYSGRVKSGAWLRTGKTGVADRQFIHAKRTVYIEHKRAIGGKQSKEQIEFEQHCIKNEQLYILAESSEHVEKVLKEEGII